MHSSDSACLDTAKGQQQHQAVDVLVAYLHEENNAYQRKNSPIYLVENLPLFFRAIGGTDFENITFLFNHWLHTVVMRILLSSFDHNEGVMISHHQVYRSVHYMYDSGDCGSLHGY